MCAGRDVTGTDIVPHPRVTAKAPGVIAAAVLVAIGVPAIAAGGCSDSSYRGAGQSDTVATHEYLDAREHLMKAYRGQLDRASHAVDKTVAVIGEQCGGALRNAPRAGRNAENNSGALGVVKLNGGSDSLLLEAITALELSLSSGRRTAAATFRHKVASLEWSDTRATQAVRSLGALEAALERRSVPAFCRDVKAWVASRYRQLPADVTSGEAGAELARARLFNVLVESRCPTADPGFSVLHLVIAHGDGDRSRVHELERLEADVVAQEQEIIQRGVAALERKMDMRRARRAAPRRRPAAAPASSKCGK